MNKDTIPRNSKGQPHGYWKQYVHGVLWNDGMYNNGKRIGIWFFHYRGRNDMKYYYIK